LADGRSADIGEKRKAEDAPAPAGEKAKDGAKEGETLCMRECVDADS
jgi:hypothetical protein